MWSVVTVDRLHFLFKTEAFYGPWSESQVAITTDCEYEPRISIRGRDVIQRRCESPRNPEAISNFTELAVYRFFFAPCRFGSEPEGRMFFIIRSYRPG